MLRVRSVSRGKVRVGVGVKPITTDDRVSAELKGTGGWRGGASGPSPYEHPLFTEGIFDFRLLSPLAQVNPSHCARFVFLSRAID